MSIEYITDRNEFEQYFRVEVGDLMAVMFKPDNEERSLFSFVEIYRPHENYKNTVGIPV